ncbi:MAG: hypothetical protein RJQ09_05785 [Cyclobacteriaceae bacterium]
MHYTNIPKEFYSFESGEPFRNCKMCDRDLTGPSSHYVIEKAIKKYTGYKAWDVVFEYAICVNCAGSFRNELSKDSMHRIETYFMQNVDMNKQQKRLNHENPQVEDFVNECILTGASKSDVDEYQIFGECRGDKFMFGPMPYMVSGQAIDKISEMLSAKTLDELDGFSEKFLGPSPELEGLFTGPRVVLI